MAPAVYLILMTVFGIGAAAFTRSSAFAIGVSIPMLVMVSTILSNVPFRVVSNIAQFLPDLDGARMMRSYLPGDASLGPLTGGVALVAWAVRLLWLGLKRTERQDITV